MVRQNDPSNVSLHLVVLKGLVSFSNPDRQTGHIIATSRVSQAGQCKRVEPDEKKYLLEGTPIQTAPTPEAVHQ